MNVPRLLLVAVLCCVVCMLGTVDSGVPRDGKTGQTETLAETEKRLKKLVNSGFKIALPFMMSVFTKVQLNSDCLQGLLLLLRGVMDIRDWAIKMVDALGKPSAGILEGTATAMGDYDECLDVVVPKKKRPPPTPPYSPDQVAYNGQYCVVKIHLPDSIRKAAMDYQAGNRTNSALANSQTFLRTLVKMAPRADVAEMRLGVCIPSTCNLTDLQAIVDEISDMVELSASAVRCEKKGGTAMDLKRKIILSLIGTIIFLTIVGTSVDIILRLRSTAVANTEIEHKGKMTQVALAFSMPRNLQDLMSLQSEDSSKISCVRGLTFISVCLYVVVWTYATPQDFNFLKYRSAFSFHKFMDEWWFTIFANASAGVDTLFLIAGLLISYRLWWKSSGSKAKLNVSKFVLKWYTRFTLSQVIVICLLLCLPLMGNGPIWHDVVTPVVKNCEKKWWLNMLAINNFWSSDVTCLPHTWLMCCLFHMLLLTPILLFILSKSLTLGLFVNVAIIFGSSIAIAMVTLMNNFPPAPAFYFMSFINLKLIWQRLFIQAYDHIGPFCIGILLGFFIHRYDKMQLKKITVCIGWIVSVACNLAVLCGLYGYRHGEEMETTLSALYAGVHRIVWAGGIAWLIFACAYGYGGFVRTILSWKLFIPCNRIAPMMYLLHPLMLLLHEGQLRERMYMAYLDQAMYAAAYIVFTTFIAATCYVTFVAPFRHFEKKFWYSGDSNQETKVSVDSSAITSDSNKKTSHSKHRSQEKRLEVSKA